MSNITVLGIYEDEEVVLKALHKIKESEYEADDLFSPFPIHGVDELLNIKRSRLTYVCFGAGLVGGISALAGMGYLNVFDWPTVIGGKNFFALPAYIPIIFEATILVAALTTVAAFFYRSNMFPGKNSTIIHKGVTNDKFVITINSLPGKSESIGEFLKSTGANQVEIKEV